MDLARVLPSEKTFVRLSAIVNKKDSTDKFILDFEKSLARTLTADYLDRADAAVKAAMKQFKGTHNKREAEAIKKAVEKEMLKFNKDAASTVNDLTSVFYKEVTRRFINKYGLKIEKAGKVTARGKVNFSQKDLKAIDVVQKITVQSAGSYFPDQLQGKVSEVIDEVVLDEGLPIEEAATRLEGEVRGALGNNYEDALPASFATNPSAYFSILATNASVQATALGRMIAMDDAGIKTYRIVAIIDQKTSNICRSLNGKEFSVSDSMKVVGKFFDLTSTEGLKGLLPFTNNDTVPKWASKGGGFPPYHNHCRSTVIPVVV